MIRLNKGLFFIYESDP